MVEIQTRIWNGEHCYQCATSLENSHEVFGYDGKCFCCKSCFGEYLADKFEGDSTWVDFISWEEYKQMEAERKAEFNAKE